MTEENRVVLAAGAGGPEVLRLENRPRPVPGPHELLVRVHAAGVNRPDVMQRQGNYPPPPGASEVLGLELAGEVTALGEGVTRFAPGARVMGLVHSGGYADWALVHEEIAIGLPDSLGYVEAAAIPETLLHGLEQRLRAGRAEAGRDHPDPMAAPRASARPPRCLAKAFGATVLVTAGGPEKLHGRPRPSARITPIDYRSADFVAEA
ncbi:alcohol dehydrogenase catalytic domain-containing protein, partial [Cereibacter changlensis]|uniref:alcohol dehydrogenase catalytic domain-containing protein n=1 Tax=Cereibacter changlensis TaxID=402884 RepID=UPI002158A79C